ncbi:hypothetical protein KUTeg_023760 [Tegillarca granosa]|uniref:EGF-like domain-containing protein n=1 Tax=Tegillarca granosa TaxID=220873 RepID=A0ABQ9E864_TEGGR|nr:hypothetical protein KUTeg_023760 [Tegillarca granosa]
MRHFAYKNEYTLQEHDIDGNACEKGTHTCHKDALCINTRRKYRCRCKPGYYGTGKICVALARVSNNNTKKALKENKILSCLIRKNQSFQFVLKRQFLAKRRFNIF